MVTKKKDHLHNAEHWMQVYWRPLMAIQYMITCLCDFVIFPVLWSILQAKDHGAVATQWVPITLGSGGFYHMAMGAIIGITAWGRTQEKMTGTNAPASVPQVAVTTFQSPVSSDITSPLPSVVPLTPVVSGFAGKKAPAPLSDPIL